MGLLKVRGLVMSCVWVMNCVVIVMNCAMIFGMRVVVMIFVCGGPVMNLCIYLARIYFLSGMDMFCICQWICFLSAMDIFFIWHGYIFLSAMDIFFIWLGYIFFIWHG